MAVTMYSARALSMPGLGAPGLIARLALVRDQLVVPGNAVHGGREGVVFEPAPVEPVGEVAS
jgi:hypothetical protein